MPNAVHLIFATHVCYIVLGIGITIWVARTLRIHGRAFFTTGCKGNTELADSLSHLFSVGFYLLHIGFVLLALRLGGRVINTVGAIELLSTKIGLVLMLLGLSHFVHVAIYARIHGKPGPVGSSAPDYAVSAEVVDSSH